MHLVLFSLALISQTPNTRLPAPAKTLPVPPAPAKTLPVPPAPAKLTPQEQRPPSAQAQTSKKEILGPEQQVWINQRGCYCVAQQVLKGNPACEGKWRVRYRIATPQGNYTYRASGYGGQSYAAYGSPAAFLAMLNNTRARYGLPPVGYDPNLEGWAASNNAQQGARGIGHYVMGPARRQNSAMGWSVQQVHQMWMNSPGHRAAMLDPSIQVIGLAQNGPWWTMNAR